MKMDKKYLEHVMTSGEAAMRAINQKFENTFYHLGPARDISVFEKVKDNRTVFRTVTLFYAQDCQMIMILI